MNCRISSTGMVHCAPAPNSHTENHDSNVTVQTNGANNAVAVSVDQSNGPKVTTLVTLPAVNTYTQVNVTNIHGDRNNLATAPGATIQNGTTNQNTQESTAIHQELNQRVNSPDNRIINNPYLHLPHTRVP